MNERRREQTEERDSAETRTEWSRPEVDRLVAGAAEGSADISTDGVDIPS